MGVAAWVVGVTNGQPTAETDDMGDVGAGLLDGADEFGALVAHWRRLVRLSQAELAERSQLSIRGSATWSAAGPGGHTQIPCADWPMPWG